MLVEFKIAATCFLVLSWLMVQGKILGDIKKSPDGSESFFLALWIIALITFIGFFSALMGVWKL